MVAVLPIVLTRAISGWLKTQYPHDESMRLSHETVYRIQAREVLKKELLDHLRSKRRMRRSRQASDHGQSRGRSSMPSRFAKDWRKRKIERFLAIEKGDLLSGAKNSYIATLVERHSRFVMLIKVPSKDTEAVVAGLSQHVRQLPTLTDVGSWIGDGQTQGLYGGHRCASLFLRSPESLAAWDERKHESAPTTILSVRNRPIQVDRRSHGCG
jgi:hypothetical protein